MDCKVNYSPSALRDLDSIDDYISFELSNVHAAEMLISDIIEAIDRLEEFPLSGTPLYSIVDLETDYYFLVVKNYLVFYRFLNNVVYIDRVLYSKRDYLKILFGTKRKKNPCIAFMMDKYVVVWLCCWDSVCIN